MDSMKPKIYHSYKTYLLDKAEKFHKGIEIHQLAHVQNNIGASYLYKVSPEISNTLNNIAI